MDLINEFMKHDKDHKPGDAVPIFKLIRMMSLHDPRWGKKDLKLEKTVSAYAREIAPPETYQEKQKRLAMFKEASILRVKGKETNLRAGAEGLRM